MFLAELRVGVVKQTNSRVLHVYLQVFKKLPVGKYVK
jgi:hypothetical protein